MFVQTSNSGVAYWRLVNFWEAFHRNGLCQSRVLWWQKDLIECHPWETDLAKPEYIGRITSEMNAYAREADVIIMQMLHTEASYSLMCALKDAYPHVPILAEIDDDIIDTPQYNIASSVYGPGTYFTKVALNQFRLADGMIVSTPYLKEVYSEFNDRIAVMPNSIDLKHWARLRQRKKPGLRIGWAGGQTHDDDLLSIESVFRNIVKNNPSVRFVLVMGTPHTIRELPGVEYVSKWERIDRYPQFLSDLDWDIALAPLVDNKFNRGKSNLRWLESAALGIPCVASKVGHFAETIRHGIDGFLAETPEEFEHYVQMLIDDRKLRRLIGLGAQERIRKDFNVDEVAKIYLSFLKSVVDSPPFKTPPMLSLGIEEAEPLPLLQEGKA